MSLSSDYSLVDRVLHRVAFAHPTVQKAMAALEEDFLGNKFAQLRPARPVFITGLPRAGTTLLLNLFYSTNEFVTHTYRHMPFILAPLLWSKISRPFRQMVEAKERAHADGMMISIDAPEAFEEVIWLAYLRNSIVRPDRLLPLTIADISVEFAAGLRAAIQKLIYTAAETSAVAPRYISKNNANISRIDLLAQLFPDATIVVPFRHPLAHVSSLMGQHEYFTIEHRKDRFAKKYMEWLGHYEFGENFRPLNIDGWLDTYVIPEQIDAEFWLQYWTVAYSHVLDRGSEQVVLVNFDRLLADGGAVLARIADRVGLDNRSGFIQGEEILRAPTTNVPYTTDISNQTYAAAQGLYARLEQQAI